MKIKVKKLMAFLIAVSLSVTAMAGCSSQTNNTSSAGTGTKTGNDKSEPVSIQWYGADTFPQWMNDFLAKEIGVTVEGITSDPEKTQAMIAAGNLPDLGYYWDPQRDITQAIKSGGIIDLTPHLDKLPNITANAPEMIEFMKANKSDGTGKLYGVTTGTGLYGGNEIDTGCYSATVRWDIYKKAGSPKVTDTQSYLECLKKMQEVYPETEDGIKTYGMSLFGEWDGLDCISTNKIIAIQGVLENNIGYNQYDIVNKKLEPMIEKGSHYIEALKTFYTCNQMGILDPDSMTMKFQDSQAKLINGSTLSAMWGAYPAEYNTSERTRAEEPSGYMPLVWEGQYPVVVGEQKLGRDPLSVSSTTKNLDACLKFINFLYDYDNSLTLINGPQGFLWDIKDDKLVLTEKYRELKLSGEKPVLESGEIYENTYANNPAILGATIHPKYNQTLTSAAWTESLDLSLDGNKLMEDWGKFYGAKTPSEWLNKNNQIVVRPRESTLLQPIPSDLVIIQDAVKEIVKEKSWKMIYAKNEAEFDKIYEEMRKECDGLGLQDLVKWGQENWTQAEAQVENIIKSKI